MEAGSNTARCPRAAQVLQLRLSHAVLGLLLLALSLAWSGESRAQTCDFVQLGSPTGLGPAGSQLSFQLEAQTACAPTVNVAIAITADTTGGAAVVAPANPTVVLDTPYTFFLNLGATPGGSGTLTATCLSGGCAGDVLTYAFATDTVTALPYVLAPVTANPASGSAGVPLPLTVRLQQGGAPVPGASIQWTATAPFSPASSSSVTNAAGDASASFTPATFGSFANAITAQYDPDGVPANGDEVSLAYGANIAFVARLANTGGNSQSALVNAAFAAPLQVNAQNSGAPAAGVTINWAVTSGSATLAAATSVTDAAGNAAIGITAGATAGPVTVTATRQDDPAATASYTLAVNAPGSLGIVSGNGQRLNAGVASAPMQVELKDAGGLPVPGASVAWSTSAGTLASATSSTNAAGIASNTVTVSVAGGVQVRATSALAPAPAVFDLNGALASLSGLTATQRSVAEAIDELCPALAALPTRTAPQQDLLLRCQDLTVAAGLDPAATVTALD